MIVSPFDAELFGHWWFEGPRFLETLFREAATLADFHLTTPSEFLAAHPSQQIVRPNPSSWGEAGFNRVWLDESNAWIYPHLHAATRRMIELARREANTTDSQTERALRQCARELLLAQASDWAFLIKTRTAAEYATARTREHLARFNRLFDQLSADHLELDFLVECESRSPIFPDLDWRYYS
jgi:1,4-alpha-glucan branching enzyme